MTTENNLPQEVNLENCTCMEKAFFSIGYETGLQIREMVRTQIQNHMSSIDNLKNLITILGIDTVNTSNLCSKENTSATTTETPTI